MTRSGSRRRYDPKDTHSVAHPLVGKLVAHVSKPNVSVGTVVRVDRCGRAVIARGGDYVRRVVSRIVVVAEVR